jgi:hypothetical protein
MKKRRELAQVQNNRKKMEKKSTVREQVTKPYTSTTKPYTHTKKEQTNRHIMQLEK